jgi:hypothetical protein
MIIALLKIVDPELTRLINPGPNSAKLPSEADPNSDCYNDLSTDYCDEAIGIQSVRNMFLVGFLHGPDSDANSAILTKDHLAFMQLVGATERNGDPIYWLNTVDNLYYHVQIALPSDKKQVQAGTQMGGASSTTTHFCGCCAAYCKNKDSTNGELRCCR